jgi:trans-aconitate methyltransferase
VKKYMIITAFCITGFIHAKQIPTKKIHEWDPELYAQGNTPQYSSTLHFLERNNISVEDKDILDIGCGTGETSAFLAQTAKSVHGFDACNNMVTWAKKHHKNVSFSQSCVEDFSSDKKYDLATMFFCFHWFADKEKALTQTAKSLNDDGELFGTFSTSDLPAQPGQIILKQMIAELNLQTSFGESLGRSTINTQELKAMLVRTGFDIIKCELQTNDIIFPDRTAVENFTRPVLMSRPFIQTMAPEEREDFLNIFLDRLIPVLKDTQNDQLILKMYQTIIHARKNKEAQ